MTTRPLVLTYENSTMYPSNSTRTPSTPTCFPTDFAQSKPTASQENEYPSVAMPEKGQCAGSPGQVCTGGVVLMSPTGPTAQHASLRSSRSPLGDDQVSPPSFRHRQLGDRDLCQDVNNAPYPNGGERTQQVSRKTFGLFNILNPLGSQSPSSEGSGILPPAVRPSDATTNQTVGSVPGLSSGARSFPSDQPASTSVPGASHVLSREPDRLSPLSFHGSSAKRPFEDKSPEETRPQYSNPHLPAGTPPGPPPEMSDPDRLHSQTPISCPGTQAPPSTSTQRHEEGRPQPPLAHARTSLPLNMQAGRRFPSPRSPDEAGSPWSGTLRRNAMGGPLFGVEEENAWMTLPGSEALISIPIDVSQASKKADEKRRQNAAASTRHRRKKKIMLEENSKHIEKLLAEMRLMNMKNEELTQERDFYLGGYIYLRNIVAQTPSINGLVSRLPSPTISTSNSYAKTSSLASGPSGPGGYWGDALKNERPIHRHRNDDHP
ncbi:hypothetical protein FBULB1_4699 [Fusarium bulbicola]|nr:hypothetical protein FBULB1_4699 [Fusarium bulbicola]